MNLDQLLFEIEKLGVSDEFLADLKKTLQHPSQHLVISGPPGPQKEKIGELIMTYLGIRKRVTREELIKGYLGKRINPEELIKGYLGKRINPEESFDLTPNPQFTDSREAIEAITDYFDGLSFSDTGEDDKRFRI